MCAEASGMIAPCAYGQRQVRGQKFGCETGLSSCSRAGFARSLAVVKGKEPRVRLLNADPALGAEPARAVGVLFTTG